MIQIVNTLDSLYFSSMVPDMEVVCYDWLNFSLKRGTTEILSERYWGNNKSRVWVRDLGKVIAADLGEIAGLAADYTLSFTDGNTSDSKSFRVLHFNSTIVRLKAARNFRFKSSCGEFQFNYCTIKSFS